MSRSPQCQLWIEGYTADHQHPINIRIHLFGIPIIFISSIGLINAWFPLMALVVVILMLGFYFKHDPGSLIVLSPLFILGLLIAKELTLGMNILLFIASWIAQIIGHRFYEKNNPSTFKSLVYLLVAPLYMVNSSGKN